MNNHFNMKMLSLLLFTFLHFTCLFGQVVQTSGDNSPAVIARNFSVTYGVRADAVEAILWVFEAKGYNVERRKRATEQIIKEYAQSPEKQQKTSELSEATRRKIGISEAPKIANALEWDLFARSHYLSTTGQNSPAVVAQGDVNIWYGIPPKALRALAAQLEKNKSNLGNLETKLMDQVKKYKELKTELETYRGKEEIYQKAEALLEEGRLLEAEQLIEADYRSSKKRQAYKGYVFGEAKELLLKYDEAAEGYRDAVFMDSTNSTYHLYYANNENTLAHYDEAIRHYKIAIGLDSLKSTKKKYKSILFNNVGLAWHSKGEYEKAIGYFEKALHMDVKAYGENNPNIATDYNNLGVAWNSKGEYGKAIGYYEKALQIHVMAFGENHSRVATGYNNLGEAWIAKGEYDKAIRYFEKALKIDAIFFEETHPDIALGYNNLGAAWYSKGEYGKAIGYYEKALQIDVKVFGENHPSVAIQYNNLGLAWKSKGEYSKAIGYYEKALQIDVNAFGENHPNVAREYNNLGLAWNSKRENNKAVGYFEKALKISVKALGENHPSVAIQYNNLGMALHSKGEYDKTIEYFEKALQIFLKVYGENHPNIATNYSNLGEAWSAKGEYDKAIGYFEKALQIDIKFFGENHPDVATRYNNLGGVLRTRGEYDMAIRYYEKSQKILNVFFEPDHPDQRTTAQNLSFAANSRGLELNNEKKYSEALRYFEKALQNAERATDVLFSLTCLSNIGTMQKHLQEYASALITLDKGLEKALQINAQIDNAIREKLTPEMLANSEVQAEIAESKNLVLIRFMQYHKVGCLKGLKRGKEAETLARQLWQEGIKTNDTGLLEDLKKEGYDFGKD
jgi:tetratricopeptide (TPR) repeat protein